MPSGCIPVRNQPDGMFYRESLDFHLIIFSF